MPSGYPSGGPARGPGNGTRRAAPFDTSPQKQAERGKKNAGRVRAETPLELRAREIHAETNCGMARARMRAWREKNPELVDETPMSRAEVGEIAQLAIAPALLNLIQRLHRTRSDHAAAMIINVIRELAHGKDKQEIGLDIRKSVAEMSNDELLAIALRGGEFNPQAPESAD